MPNTNVFTYDRRESYYTRQDREFDRRHMAMRFSGHTTEHDLYDRIAKIEPCRNPDPTRVKRVDRARQRRNHRS